MTQSKQTVIASLPVSDLGKSIAFYQAIGFTQDKQFSDQSLALMMLSDTFSIMLITHSKWKEFTNRQIPDAKKTAQVGFTLSRENKADVDQMVENGAKAGGIPDPNPIEDHGFMYGRSLEDPDGHIWEPKWMNLLGMS